MQEPLKYAADCTRPGRLSDRSYSMAISRRKENEGFMRRYGAGLEKEFQMEMSTDHLYNIEKNTYHREDD